MFVFIQSFEGRGVPYNSQKNRPRLRQLPYFVFTSGIDDNEQKIIGSQKILLNERMASPDLSGDEENVSLLFQ